MQTVFETRKQRLRMLREKYASWADLNEAIGWLRTDPRLSQIHSESIRSDRGTPFVMGDPTARLIEEKLGLEVGWLDTPPTYAELHQDDRISHVMKVMEAMPEWKRDQAMRLIDTIAEPSPKRSNGN